MQTWLIITLSVIGAIIIALVVLMILGKKAQKKQDEQMDQLKAQAMPMSFYIIDMKKMRLKDANLPKVVTESMPKRANIGKMPILKVKVTNRVMSLVCDPEVYKTLLPKQEVKAQVAGIYVISAKRVRGPIPEPAKKKKKGESLLDKLR